MAGELSEWPDKGEFHAIEAIYSSQHSEANPYTSLFLLAVPLMLAEPLKLAAIFIFGSGHLLAGLIVMLSAYLVSALLVERLFKIVKPKLLTLSWFMVIWKQFAETRRKAFRLLKSKWLRRRTQRDDSET